MDFVLSGVSKWLKDLLISGILENLIDLFATVNNEVGSIAADVAMTPASFSPGVFSLVRNVSETVILPIAGLLLTFICSYELIQMIIEHNQMANFETFTLFKWMMKTFFAVTLITNTFDIVMAVFDVAQNVIARIIKAEFSKTENLSGLMVCTGTVTPMLPAKNEMCTVVASFQPIGFLPVARMI